MRKAWGPCKSGTPTPLWLSNYRARYEKTPSTVLKLRDSSHVVRKELSLSGIQRPLYPGELGEDAVEVFRFGDFVGWIIEG